MPPRQIQGPTCSTSSDAPVAPACSPLLISPKVLPLPLLLLLLPYFLRSPSRSPILGWAAKACSHPATGVCTTRGRV